MDYAGIVLGVAESLAASIIYDIYKNRTRTSQRVTVAPASYNERADEDADAVRSRNMARLTLFVRFLFTFYVLYAAIQLPLMAHSLTHTGTLYLDQARYIGFALPHHPVNSDLLQTPSAVAAALLYLPLLYMALNGAELILSVIDKFSRVTRRTVIVTTIMAFTLLCLSTSVAVVYLYYSVTLQEALVSVVAAVVLTAGISGSSGRR